MPVMQVGKMRMLVPQSPMTMRVGVRFAASPGEIVQMAMVLVVTVRMRVFDRLVLVFVLMALGQMQPDAHRHQRTGRNQRPGNRIAEPEHRQTCAEKRR